MFGSAINGFASFNYGDAFNFNMLQCFVKQFVDQASVKRVTTGNWIRHLEEQTYTLLDMAEDFRSSHNLNCKRTPPPTECEATLNKLRCDLSAFLKALPKAGRDAVLDLNEMEESTNAIGSVERKFKSRYNLVCNEGSPSDTTPQSTKTETKFRSDLRYFHGELRRPYDSGNARLTNLSNICNTLTAAIDATNSTIAGSE